MRLISKLLIIFMCFALAGCNYSEQNIENSQPDAAFPYKCSPVPLMNAKQEQRQIKPEKKVLKYDNVKAIWLSYIDISPMLTGKTEQQFKSAFTQACKNISELGCNTIFVHIRPFGDALFNSEIYPASRLITGQAGQSGIFDPLAIMIDGATIPSSQMIVTPAAVEEYFNVSRAINVPIWRGCCESVSIRNTSDQPILVQNANVLFDRPDLR